MKFKIDYVITENKIYLEIDTIINLLNESRNLNKMRELPEKIVKLKKVIEKEI